MQPKSKRGCADREKSQWKKRKTNVPSLIVLPSVKGGDVLNVMLAFVPQDIKAISSTGFDAYIINDSNYTLSFAYLCAEGHNWRVRSWGTVQPNTKFYIEEFDKSILK